eukprot:763409-Hanusia_phi.AAC.8
MILYETQDSSRTAAHAWSVGGGKHGNLRQSPASEKPDVRVRLQRSSVSTRPLKAWKWMPGRPLEHGHCQPTATGARDSVPVGRPTLGSGGWPGPGPPEGHRAARGLAVTVTGRGSWQLSRRVGYGTVVHCDGQRTALFTENGCRRLRPAPHLLSPNYLPGPDLIATLMRHMIRSPSRKEGLKALISMLRQFESFEHPALLLSQNYRGPASAPMPIAKLKVIGAARPDRRRPPRSGPIFFFSSPARHAARSERRAAVPYAGPGRSADFFALGVPWVWAGNSGTILDRKGPGCGCTPGGTDGEPFFFFSLFLGAGPGGTAAGHGRGTVVSSSHGTAVRASNQRRECWSDLLDARPVVSGVRRRVLPENIRVSRGGWMP